MKNKKNVYELRTKITICFFLENSSFFKNVKHYLPAKIHTVLEQLYIEIIIIKKLFEQLLFSKIQHNEFQLE